MKPEKTLFLLVMTVLPFGVYAKDNFEVSRFLWDADKKAFSSSPVDIKSFFILDEALDHAEINSFIKDIDPKLDTDPIKSEIIYTGLPIYTSFAENSKILLLEIPHLKIKEYFGCEGESCSRDDSEEKYRKYLEDHGDEILNSLVVHTASNVVSGNTSSLVYTMADDAIASAMHDEGTPENNKNVGLNVGHYSFDGNETNVLNIPASYTYHFDKPDYYAKFSGTPIGYIETNGSKAYKTSGNASLHIPVKENWALTPAVGIGGVASKDMGTSAIVGSVSLTSVYKTKLGKADVTMGNMVSTFQTTSVGGDMQDYDLSNHIVKNAVSAQFPTSVHVMNMPLDLEATVADTQVLGDDVFIDHYNEIAFSMGSAEKTGNSRLDDMRLGFTYTFGGTNEDFNGKTYDYNGISLNFGYSF